VSAGGVLDLDGVRRFADLETLTTQLGAFSENVIARAG
jgi:hypothetical protein